jgi:glutamate-1-semialdehyde 2,1-aminomutase
VIAFEGHYNGSSDNVFHRYHAPLDQLPKGFYGPAIPGTIGMNGAPRDVLVCRWNSPEALEACLRDHADQVAAVIMEPVMGNGGVIAPQTDYLEVARALTKEFGALLIFDEVITGMRVAAGGAQQRFGVAADISVLGKAMGGGYPISAVGSTRDVMNCIVEGKLFHGGVYSGNALVMAAADAVLEEMHRDGESIYGHLESVSATLATGLDGILNQLGVPHRVQYVGPMISLLLTRQETGPLNDYRAMRQHCDCEKYIRLQHWMQRAGVYFHPNQFEPMFLSTAHTHDDIATVLERFEEGARAVLLN